MSVVECRMSVVECRSLPCLHALLRNVTAAGFRAAGAAFRYKTRAAGKNAAARENDVEKRFHLALILPNPAARGKKRRALRCIRSGIGVIADFALSAERPVIRLAGFVGGRGPESKAGFRRRALAAGFSDIIAPMQTTRCGVLLPLLMMVCGNVFMTTAWYWHLRSGAASGKPLFMIVLMSWSIALLEYSIMVPANRLGVAAGLSVAQLKVAQEVITLLVFVPFAYFVLGEKLRLDYLWAFLCLALAVYFVNRSKF